MLGDPTVGNNKQTAVRAKSCALTRTDEVREDEPHAAKRGSLSERAEARSVLTP